MRSERILWLMAAGGLSLAVFGKNPPRVARVPSDPLEMAASGAEVVNTPASRQAILQLLSRARDSYALRSAGQGYDLKVSFTVNSGGETDYDGAWQMEDVFDPQQGLHWTATASSGYTTTQIDSHGMFYREGTSGTIPLRLQEARAALFDPVPSLANVDRALIRTSTSMYHGAQMTCVLLSSSGAGGTTARGRRWEETEDCIDSQSGLLQVHSQVPGHYYAYEYSNALQLGGHLFPKKVTVTEGGKIVSEISVESLVALSNADRSLFVPTDEMKVSGPVVAMAGAQKIWRFAGRGPLKAGTIVQPVCVFGLVTPSGELVEAHSLQPSDPNSQEAVDTARRMNFFEPAPPGARPQQHFVFVIEKFVSR